MVLGLIGIVICICLPVIIARLLFRGFGGLLSLKYPSAKRYATYYTLSVLLWPILEFFWFEGISNQQYKEVPIKRNGVESTSNQFDNIEEIEARSTVSYVPIPLFHAGAGYRFNLANPIANFIYNILGSSLTCIVMSFIDILVIGSGLSLLHYTFDKWLFGSNR